MERWQLIYRLPTPDGFFDVIEATEEAIFRALNYDDPVSQPGSGAPPGWAVFDSITEDNRGNETRERLWIPIDNIHSIRNIPEEEAKEKVVSMGPKMRG